MKYFFIIGLMMRQIGICHADISDSGSLNINQQAIIGGTMTVSGNAFSVGSSTLTVSGGKVGVGTTNPLASLHISRGVNLTSDSTITHLKLSAPSDTRELSLGYDTTHDNGFIQSTQEGNGFKSLSLNPLGGNVGIGTTGPSAPLDILNATFTVTSGGIVSAPSQTGVRAVRNNTAMVIAHGANVTILFDTKDFDTQGLLNLSGSSGTVTIPTGMGGFYALSCGVDFAANATGVRTIWVRVDGGITDNFAFQSTNALSAGSTSISASTIAKLSAGDTVRCFASQTSGGSLNITAGGEMTHIAVLKLW